MTWGQGRQERVHATGLPRCVSHWRACDAAATRASANHLASPPRAAPTETSLGRTSRTGRPASCPTPRSPRRSVRPSCTCCPAKRAPSAARAARTRRRSSLTGCSCRRAGAALGMLHVARCSLLHAGAACSRKLAWAERVHPGTASNPYVQSRNAPPCWPHPPARCRTHQHTPTHA